MAAKGLSRRPLARKNSLRSDAQVRRSIIELTDEVALLKKQVQALSAENSRLREGR